MRFKAVEIASLMFGLLVNICHAQIGEIFTQPVFINEPSEHIVNQNGIIDATPFVAGKPQLFLRHLGPNAIENKVNYDVGVYTGFHSPSTYQYGEFDFPPPVGSSAVQLHGFQAGCMINTWQFDWQKVSGGGPHCAYQYLYEPDEAPAPWSKEGMSLTFQFFHTLPQFYRSQLSPANTAIGQSSMVIYLQSDNGQVIGVLANLYDLRGEYSPFSAHDGYSAFVSAPLTQNTADNESCQFFEKSIYSNSFDKKTFSKERFFRLHITRQNLDCIFETMEDKGLNLAREPEQWKVHSWLWLLEIGGHSPFANASLGGSIRDPYLLTCTGVDC